MSHRQHGCDMKRLRASLADAPVVQFDDYAYFVHPITDGIPTVDPSLLREVTNAIVTRIDIDAIDRIVAPEAMGIHLGTALSLHTDVPMTIARKRSYGLDGEVGVAQVTGYDENELYLNGIDGDDTVVVVDDVISTGGTRAAIVDAIEAIGADLERYVVVFDKHDTPVDETLEATDALLRVQIQDDAVVEVR